MAERAGPIGWDFDGQTIQSEKEKQEVEGQAQKFAATHADVITPLMDRIHELKSLNVADNMYMMAAILITSGNNLLAYIKSQEMVKDTTTH